MTHKAEQSRSDFLERHGVKGLSLLKIDSFYMVMVEEAYERGRRDGKAAGMAASSFISGYKQIAEYLGCSKRTARRRVKALKDCGLVHRDGGNSLVSIKRTVLDKWPDCIKK